MLRIGAVPSPVYSHTAAWQNLSSSRLASPSTLVLDAEVAAAALLADERVLAHQLAELEEVGDAAGLLERLVERVALAEDGDVAPELLAQLRDLRERVARATRSVRAMPQSSHMMWPSSLWNESTERLPRDVHQLVEPRLDLGLGRR